MKADFYPCMQIQYESGKCPFPVWMQQDEPFDIIAREPFWEAGLDFKHGPDTVWDMCSMCMKERMHSAIKELRIVRGSCF